MNSAYVPRSSLIPLRTMAIVVAAARAFQVLQRWAKVRRQCYGRAIWNGHGQLQDRRQKDVLGVSATPQARTRWSPRIDHCSECDLSYVLTSTTYHGAFIGPQIP